MECKAFLDKCCSKLAVISEKAIKQWRGFDPGKPCKLDTAFNAYACWREIDDTEFGCAERKIRRCTAPMPVEYTQELVPSRITQTTCALFLFSDVMDRIFA